MRYGSNSITNSNSVQGLPSIAVSIYNNFDFNTLSMDEGLTLLEASASPTVSMITGFDFSSLGDHPIEGTVYRFTPNQADINSPTNQLDFTVYPTSSELKVDIPSNSELKIIDLTGKILINIKSNNGLVNVDYLKPGIYYLQVEYNSATSTKRFTKI